MSKLAVGFIGLGNIGRPMAINLLGGPFELTVYDVDEAARRPLLEAGALAAEPPDLAARCNLIELCVRDNSDVEALLYGDQGLFARATPGTVIAIHSTITQQALRQWVADGARRELTVIDAPVTGGAHGAQARELVYMVGGDAEVLERCRPALATSAREIIHAGPVGTGIALKLCINMMTFSSFIAIKEATRLAEAAGLDPEVLYALGRSNGAVGDFNQRFISNRGAVFAGCDPETARSVFEPFGRLGEKDLDAALATAAELGIDLPATRHSRDLILQTFIEP